MSTVAYPITTGDASSGGVSITITAFSLSDSGVGSETLITPTRQVVTSIPPSLLPPSLSSVIAPGSKITFSLPVCIPIPYIFSSLSGGVTVYSHCPNQVIEPSVWNNRRTILLNQLKYLYQLIQLINLVNQNTGMYLTSKYNVIMDMLNTLKPVTVGDPVSHDHYNAIWNHVLLAYNTFIYYFTYLYGYNYTVPSQLQSIFNPIAYVPMQMSGKLAFDIVSSNDWNKLTEALLAIDEMLNSMTQWLPIIIKLTNPGYTYPNGQQIPIAIQPSNYINVNEDLSNVYFLDANGNKVPFWVEVDAKNNNGTAVVWLKATDTMINQLNSGSTQIYMIPTITTTIDGVNYGINSTITGSLSTDNIGNIMDQGLLYSIWANTSQTVPNIAYSPTVEPLLGTSLNTQSFTFSSTGWTLTVTLQQCCETVSSLFTSTIPCTVSGGSYSNCRSRSCTSQANMLSAWEAGYSCGVGSPISPDYTWLAKFIGWVQASEQSTMYVLVDDAINVWLSLICELGSDGANWASCGSNILSSWTNQSMQSTPYTATIPFGTHRFDLHYANVDAPQDALMVWFNNPINLFHAKFVPKGYMPSATITQMTWQ